MARKQLDGLTHVGMREARASLADLVRRAGAGIERVVIENRGAPVAALVCPEDAGFLGRDGQDVRDWIAVGARELRSRFAWALGLVERGPERVLVTSDGRPVAALIGRLDLERLESADAKLDESMVAERDAEATPPRNPRRATRRGAHDELSASLRRALRWVRDGVDDDLDVRGDVGRRTRDRRLAALREIGAAIDVDLVELALAGAGRAEIRTALRRALAAAAE